MLLRAFLPPTRWKTVVTVRTFSTNPSIAQSSSIPSTPSTPSVVTTHSSSPPPSPPSPSSSSCSSSPSSPPLPLGKNLLGLPLSDLEDEFAKIGLQRFRAQQVFSWIYQKGVLDFRQMTSISTAVREDLARRYNLHTGVVHTAQTSTCGTKKWLIGVGKDTHKDKIESVYIPMGRQHSRGSVCVSSQIGCSLTCAFCHTGNGMDKKSLRNLSTAEIVSQVLLVKQQLNDFRSPTTDNSSSSSSSSSSRVTNVVMMGMGEPLYNYRAVRDALRIWTSPHGFLLGLPRITVSTSGVVPGIDRLGLDFGGTVALAISLHAGNDDLRDELVPMNKQFPLRELMQACKRYQERDWTGTQAYETWKNEQIVLKEKEAQRQQAKKLEKEKKKQKKVSLASSSPASSPSSSSSSSSSSLILPPPPEWTSEDLAAAAEEDNFLLADAVHPTAPTNSATRLSSSAALLRQTSSSSPLTKLGRRRITFEYVMLRGVNDSLLQARNLVHLLDGLICMVNLIPFNPWPGTRFECTEEAHIIKFAQELIDRGVPTTIRWPRGRDIDGACGQLAAKSSLPSSNEAFERPLNINI